ncbi:MAG: DUF4149 domain-containing protein [Zoogloeaceae bacterium]|nr:DUF4149 domain-containing protein [Zoogloeaceae bacterium]
MRAMTSLANALFHIALTAWAGMLWSIGYLVVPVLFYTQERMLAGEIAGHLFAASGWAGLALGGYLLLMLLSRQGLKGSLRTLAFWLTALMLILTAVSLFGIQPFMAHLKENALPLDVMRSPLRERFVTWHGIASSLYLLQSLLALALTLRVNFGKPVQQCRTAFQPLFPTG